MLKSVIIDFNTFSTNVPLMDKPGSWFLVAKTGHPATLLKMSVRLVKPTTWFSHRCSVRKRVLRNFAKFTGKHLRQSLSFNRVAGLRPATLLKKRPRHSCFPVNFAKFLRTLFLTEHLRWLLFAKLTT